MANAQRRLEEQKGEAVKAPSLLKTPPPNPEVKGPSKRRALTVSVKLEFLKRFDLCESTHEKGILLRSEGFYLSQIYRWKRDIREGKLFIGYHRTPGPIPKNNKELDQLKKENERLKKKLHQAELLIDLQKKVAALFGDAEEIN